jgi:FkbM family methyltransferase
MLSTIKQTAISLGLYKPARALFRAIDSSQRRHFRQQRAFLAQFVQPGSLAFDVGANIGTRSEIMLSLGARVIAFEPQPICARETRARGNRLLTVIEKAVGESSGFADLHLKKSDVQASLLNDWQGGPATGTLRVAVTTLDEEIKQFGLPNFCKIDVEGFEPQVVRGLSSAIPALSFEYHCDEISIAMVRSVLARLAELGTYEINLVGYENTSWLSPQWLSVPRFIESFPQIAGDNFWGDCFARLKH